MEETDSVKILAALAQPTRIQAYRLLVQREPDGLPAGEVARQLNVPAPTMSAHLAVLAQAGLVHSMRQSQSIIYRASIPCLRELVLYLLKDCCSGQPDLCASLIPELLPCCPPKEITHG